MSAKYFCDVGCGFIPGRSIVNVFGNAFDLRFSDLPLTVWPLKTLYDFNSAGEIWQIRSTSPSDALSGIGAQRVSIDILDINYNRTPQVVNLNGTTPVVLPTGANNFRVNDMVVFQADPAGIRTNVGDIILEPLGGGSTRAFILAEKGKSTNFIYTVPAGHNLWIPNFLFNMAKLGGGDVAWRREFRVLLPNGTRVTSTTASIIQGSVPIVVPTGFVITEKNSMEVTVTFISAEGLDVNVQITGILTDLTHPSVIERRPTAFTEY